jgi:hypothetical protein
MIPVADFSTLVAEQLATTLTEDDRARGLLDALASYAPETSPEIGELQPLLLILAFPGPIAPHVLVEPEEKSDAGIPIPPDGGSSSSGGSSDAGTSSGSGTNWHFEFSGGGVIYTHNDDGSWEIKGGSPHMSISAGGGKKKP